MSQQRRLTEAGWSRNERQRRFSAAAEALTQFGTRDETATVSGDAKLGLEYWVHKRHPLRFGAGPIVRAVHHVARRNRSLNASDRVWSETERSRVIRRNHHIYHHPW